MCVHDYGTPLLDLKPYVPEFDCYPNSKAGWFERVKLQALRRRRSGSMAARS